MGDAPARLAALDLRESDFLEGFVAVSLARVAAFFAVFFLVGLAATAGEERVPLFPKAAAFAFSIS